MVTRDDTFEGDAFRSSHFKLNTFNEWTDNYFNEHVCYFTTARAMVA